MEAKLVVVAHLDHTDERGGAQLALARMIMGNSNWDPRLFVPPRKLDGRGAFDNIGIEALVEVGISQPPGAVSGSSLRKIDLFGRLLLHSLAVRANRLFRSSDVVHANTSRAALIGLIACVGSRRRLIVHLRDAFEKEALGEFNANLLALALSRAAGVVANSNFTMRTAAEHIGLSALAVVIPSPIGLTTPRLITPPGAVVTRIGMLARIADFKGQDLLIRAFADVFRDSTVVLELAGSPAFGTEDHLAYLKRLAAELGVASQVRFLGHIVDVWSLIDTWDICVSASLRHEGMGQNVLQYLAAGRPTIAPSSGGPADWIEHDRTGLLVELGSQGELSAALGRLASDGDLRRRLSQTLADERPVPTDGDIRNQFQTFFNAVNTR